MNNIHILTPTHWHDYSLLDSGHFQKLERFGEYVTIRPEPQAVWSPSLSETEWKQRAHVQFVSKSSSSGIWQKLKTMPDQWQISYPLPQHHPIKMRLGLTAFKHVGVFPEQAVNWDYISACLGKMQSSEKKVLNLFAYTGGASLAARAAGATTYHLDSIKQVVSWARENMELSGQRDIRWVVEDALKFVKREQKRGNTYHGIILDPPAYGHGPNGEKWKLEDQLNDMMMAVMHLLDAEEHFLILNAYSLGFSALILQNLLQQKMKQVECGELYLQDSLGKKLPLGAFARTFKPLR